MSIKGKLLLVFISVTSIVLLSSFIVLNVISVNTSKKSFESVLNVVGSILADRCAAALAFHDVESANSNLATLVAHESVVYACIRTSENVKFAEYNVDFNKVYRCEDFGKDQKNIFKDQYISSIRKISVEGQVIGSLEIKARLDKFEQNIKHAAYISLVLLIILLLLAIFFVSKIISHVISPIQKLKDITQEVAINEDYSLRAEVNSSDEVGVLVSTVNNMLDQIEARDDALKDEKDKAEKSAMVAKRYARETELVNKDLESEIKERARIEEELYQLNETLEDKVQDRTRELKEMNEKIGEVSRSAGMAEVASGVLHNVGNVLNSVNISASVIREHVKQSKANNLMRVVKMLDKNKANMAEYLSSDEKGKQIPKFLELLSEQLVIEKENLYKELDELANSIDHIKNVISMQQSYAGGYGVREKIYVSDLVEDALKINLEGMARHDIDVVKMYKKVPYVYLDKHKAMQIIINMISNAKYALIDSDNNIRQMIVTVDKNGEDIVVEVSDTGVGIAQEDMPRIFEYGFKKRRNGHGFGLHHSAITANELGGKIEAHSDGKGKGARFVLRIPIEANLKNAE